MAETAKMLNPDKRVLLPDLEAGCSLAESCPAGKLQRFQEMLRENGRRFQTVTYINSTAAVKALSDWVVTSGNAQEIIRPGAERHRDPVRARSSSGAISRGSHGPQDDPVERRLHRSRDLQRRRSAGSEEEAAGAVTIAHPECPANIREHSDFVGGTEAMIKYVGGVAEPTDFLVATEANMMWQLQNKFPQHRYHPVPGITCACNKCPHMARNTLEKLRDCLVNGKPEITWQPEFDRAREVVQRSLLK